MTWKDLDKFFYRTHNIYIWSAPALEQRWDRCFMSSEETRQVTIKSLRKKAKMVSA